MSYPKRKKSAPPKKRLGIKDIISPLDIHINWYKEEVMGEYGIYNLTKKKAESGSVTVENSTAQELALIDYFGFLSPREWKKIRRELSDSWWKEREEAFLIYSKIAPELKNTIEPRLQSYFSELNGLYYQFRLTLKLLENVNKFVTSQNELLSELRQGIEKERQHLKRENITDEERKTSLSIIEKTEKRVSDILSQNFTYYNNTQRNEGKYHLYPEPLHIEKKENDFYIIEDGIYKVNERFIESEFIYIRTSVNCRLWEAKGFIISVEEWIKKYNLEPFLYDTIVNLFHLIKYPPIMNWEPEIFKINKEKIKNSENGEFLFLPPDDYLLPDYYSAPADMDVYEENLDAYNSLI